MLAGASWGTPAMANPAELDGWCAQAKLPSSIALCSDPELRELAIQRKRAFEAARGRLNVDAYNALLRDQNGWVRTYSASCGISATQPPALPLSSDTLACLKRAGQARVEYLWSYVAGGSPRVRTHKVDSQPAHFVIQGPRRGTDHGSRSFLAE